MAMSATARFITVFSKLRVVSTIDDQDRCTAREAVIQAARSVGAQESVLGQAGGRV